MRSFVLIVALLVAPLGVFAQAFPAVEAITTTLTPAYPRPYDTARITISSSAIDLTSSSIVITANGIVIGENTRTAQIEVGGPGSFTTVRITATHLGEKFTKDVVISPADVALAVEPQTTAPPFYDGGRLVAPLAPVRIVAVPDIQTAPGVRVNPAGLVYTWRLGNRILQGQSGIGKNVLTATAPVRYRDAEVSVTVTTQDSSRVAYGVVAVSPAEPVVRIYEDDPLLGTLLSRALSGSFSLAADEGSFRAVPYHFASNPSISWTLNGAPSGNTPTLTVRTAGASAGTARLSVKTTGADVFETSTTDLSVQFNAARGTGIFGF